MGQVPVFSYVYGVKQLTDCEPIANGNTYFDNIFYYHHNTSECSGAFAGDLNCIPTGASRRLKKRNCSHPRGSLNEHT